eukprot:Colp12_sorted_trinity150504_noHs@22228
MTKVATNSPLTRQHLRAIVAMVPEKERLKIVEETGKARDKLQMPPSVDQEALYWELKAKELQLLHSALVQEVSSQREANEEIGRQNQTLEAQTRDLQAANEQLASEALSLKAFNEIHAVEIGDLKVANQELLASRDALEGHNNLLEASLKSAQSELVATQESLTTTCNELAAAKNKLTATQNQLVATEGQLHILARMALLVAKGGAHVYDESIKEKVVSEKVSEKVAQCKTVLADDNMSEIMFNEMADSVFDNVSGRMSDKVSGRMSDKISNKVSGSMCGKVSVRQAETETEQSLEKKRPKRGRRWIRIPAGPKLH